MARFSNGGSVVLDNTAVLTPGYYYYVISGSVVHFGTTYNIGDVFKCQPGVSFFTGSGTAITAFTTEVFNHFETNAKPRTNNVGNSRNGDIIRGSGDPVFVRGTLNVNEFPINQKFIQVQYIIKVNNLKP